MRLQEGKIPSHPGALERVGKMACGSVEFDSPFPVSPSGGKPGRGRFPPRRKHAARQPKALARIDAAGSPHKRGSAPLCIPRTAGPEYRDLAGRDVDSRLQEKDHRRRLHKRLDTTSVPLWIS